jgi:hypothetical protein
LQSIELLCKHVHNMWWVGSKPIPKLWLHKNQSNKHLSSSTLPTICTMANLTNFTYHGKLEESTWNVVTRHHILVKRFKSKRGVTHVSFDFIVILNMP